MQETKQGPRDIIYHICNSMLVDGGTRQRETRIIRDAGTKTTSHHAAGPPAEEAWSAIPKLLPGALTVILIGLDL